MSINVKNYTKDQMAKMVEDAQEKTAALEAEITELKNYIDVKNDLIAEYANLKAGMQRKNAALTEQVSQVNGEAITRENVIANLKADNDFLRGKLNDTETALGRSANETSQLVGDLKDARMQVLDLGTEVDVAHNHPWRNLWAWFKRKLGGEGNEHVS